MQSRDGLSAGPLVGYYISEPNQSLYRGLVVGACNKNDVLGAEPKGIVVLPPSGCLDDSRFEGYFGDGVALDCFFEPCFFIHGFIMQPKRLQVNTPSELRNKKNVA